jgi:mRNA interferase RelE/StbE
VGDFRVIVRFYADRLVILVIEVGNRREVYR